jgi:hypothetical protein
MNEISNEMQESDTCSLIGSKYAIVDTLKSLILLRTHSIPNEISILEDYSLTGMGPFLIHWSR